MSTDVLDARPHLFREGVPGAPVLVMLHGTGGDEHDIAALAERIDPDATVLAPRGRVRENGMNRWFRRRDEGVFDVASVREEAASLAEVVAAASDRFGLAGRRMIAVGFSNGANIGLATALLHPEAIDRVVAFSGMYPLGSDRVDGDLAAVRVLLLNGRTDAMAPAASVDVLEQALRERHATVTRVTRDGGHGITASELDTAREWIADNGD